jgi:hypothetical protein
LGQTGEGDDHAVQCFFLTTQLLRFFGVVPDRGVF